MTTPMKLQAHYYQQFDADFGRDVPAEGYGGWRQAELTFARRHTALVVMHAWDCGTREQFPGWHRCVEYIPRAEHIARTVFPPLLATARQTGFRLYHVVGGGTDYKTLPGYRRAVALAKPTPEPPSIQIHDPLLEKVRAFRGDHVFVGRHNQQDVQRGWAKVCFMPQALPQGEEGVAENEDQLFALCQNDGVNHLVYMGFAINWCLLLSPGGMHAMSKRGLMCSAIRQATTAVENKETARDEWGKTIALWRVALAFGFVFDDHEFIRAMKAGSGQ